MSASQIERESEVRPSYLFYRCLPSAGRGMGAFMYGLNRPRHAERMKIAAGQIVLSHPSGAWMGHPRSGDVSNVHGGCFDFGRCGDLRLT
jgi:hypothetical protein